MCRRRNACNVNSAVFFDECYGKHVKRAMHTGGGCAANNPNEKSSAGETR